MTLSFVLEAIVVFACVAVLAALYVENKGRSM